MTEVDYYDRAIGPGHMPLFITPQQAVEMTGLNYKIVLELCQTGKIPAVLSGRRYKINRIKMMEYLDHPVND